MKGFVSIEVIIDRAMRNPLLLGLNYEQVIDYVFDFFGIVGVPDMFDDKVETLEVSKWRVELPCDFVEDIQVLYKHGCEWIPIQKGLDTFINHKDEICNFEAVRNITFNIKGTYLYLSKEVGIIKLLYRSIRLDDNMMPMIPDDGNFLRAVEDYIKYKHLRILYDMGKIPRDVMDRAEQDYCWSVGSLDTHLNRLTLSKAESFFNSYSQLVIKTNQFAHRFKDYGNMERLNRN